MKEGEKSGLHVSGLILALCLIPEESEGRSRERPFRKLLQKSGKDNGDSYKRSSRLGVEKMLNWRSVCTYCKLLSIKMNLHMGSNGK